MPEVAYDVAPRAFETSDERGRDEPAAPAAKSGQRLVSLDALRGFDMFWIVGIDTIIELVMKRPGVEGAGPVARALRLIAGQL
jgi:hypothetical protein